MKKQSLLIVSLILSTSLLLAIDIKQDDKNKPKAPPKNAILQPKDSKSGEKKDSTKHQKKLPAPNTGNK